MLYKTILEPHYTYCSSILYLCTNDDIDRLQILQNKCMRNILKMDRFTSTEIMTKALGILYQNSLFYKGINLFNELPEEIRREKIFTKYDKKLRTHIMNNH